MLVLTSSRTLLGTDVAVSSPFEPQTRTQGRDPSNKVSLKAWLAWLPSTPQTCSTAVQRHDLRDKRAGKQEAEAHRIVMSWPATASKRTRPPDLIAINPSRSASWTLKSAVVSSHTRCRIRRGEYVERKKQQGRGKAARRPLLLLSQTLLSVMRGKRRHLAATQRKAL